MNRPTPSFIQEPQTTKERDALKQGKFAYLLRLTIASNPYDQSTETACWVHWARGFVDAQNEAVSKRWRALYLKGQPR